MTGPLEGVIILDLTQQLAGPGGTMLLGDMGADIIRIDPPPEQVVADADLAALVPGQRYLRRVDLNIGRSKRSISLDLSRQEAREIVYAIARRADVVCENYRPGVAEKLGMDLESFRKVNPDIIYSRVSAYGDRGPEAFRPGFDIVAQAGAGSMVAGPDGEMPTPETVPIGDVTAFCLEALGIVAALYHRKVTGEAQTVSTSMLAGAVLQNILRLISIDNIDRQGRLATLTGVKELLAQGSPYRAILEATATGIGGQPQVNADAINSLVSIYYGVYRTKDGYVTVGCLNLRQQRRLNEALDLGDPRFEPGTTPQSLAEARARFQKMRGKARAAFAERTTDEMLALLEARDIACAPIRSLLELFDSPHLLENQYIVEHVHPKAGLTRLLGHPIAFEKTPMRIACPAPPVGADSDEILSWLEYSPERIRDLRDRRVVC